ncbi:MAG: galactokinase [Planctomycetota bacterium]
MPPVNDQLSRCVNLFREAYGHDPTHAAVAPGRVNLIGEHIDYCDGYVMPLAIERQAVAVGRPREDSLAKLRSTVLPGEAEFDIDSAPIGLGEPNWSRYLRGVTAFSYTPTGFELMLDSDVPVGGGLSSSAAIEVATATLLEQLGGIELGPVNKALLCQMAEHRFGGTKCGIMDQFISAMGQDGKALLIDCVDYSTRAVPLDSGTLAVLIINTNNPHELADEYNQRRAACAAVKSAVGKQTWRQITLGDLEAVRSNVGDEAYRRGRHVVGEIQRTLDCADAMGSGDWPQVGSLMYASHDSLRDDFEVSTPELDKLVELAAALGPEAGVIGARMTGGGFGGCTVTLAEAGKAQDLKDRLVADYQAATGIQPTAFITRPAAGARPLPL